MLLDQEMLRLVFGIKLRGLRHDKELSLKDLSERSGLSLSYLNEIENGKKYPKSEKILVLAKALDERYEDLISLELKQDFAVLQTMLEKNVLSAIPFDVFGIPVATIFQLFTEKPKKMRALIGTLLEIARVHHISIDDVFGALLRSYLDMHQNYFPSIESAAKELRTDLKLDWRASNESLKSDLQNALKTRFGISVIETELTDLSPEFRSILYFAKPGGKAVYVAKGLARSEQLLVLARELGYACLKAKSRPLTSEISNLDSFEQLFNHFSASYFASSLLIPEDEITADLNAFFSAPKWDRSLFEAILTKYAGTVESVYHRITQLLPSRFGLKNLFYLRYEYDAVRNRFAIARELHLGHFEGPHRVQLPENYCGRWLIHKLTQKQLESDRPFEMDVQRSKYHRTPNEYLILGTSFRSPLTGSVGSVCLGLLYDQKLDAKIPWARTETDLPQIVVGETCERCSVENCESRRAVYDRTLDPDRHERLAQAIKTL